MTTTRQTSTGTTLTSIPTRPVRKARKVSADRFRTPEAQDVFRARWNVAMERLSK